MKKSRLFYTTYNSITSIVSNITGLLMGFLSQTVFIWIMGKEFLGINSLFVNVISLLSIVELGLGTSIIYKLYDPIARDDKKEIKKWLDFFRGCYRIICIVMLLLGLLLTPFIESIVGTVNVDINLKVAYVMIVLSTVFSYVLAYKRSLIYAYQRNYIINIVHIIWIFTFNVSQLFVLYLTKNYYLFLLIRIIFTFLENLVLTIIANKEYKDIVSLSVSSLSDSEKKDIFEKMKAMFCHKVGAFFINGTDNLIISKFLGVIIVGLYSNYYIIINGVQMMFSQVISSVTASVGNILVVEKKEFKLDIFRKIRFLNFWIASFSGICILVLMQDFIKLWLNKTYLLSDVVLYVLVFNYFQKMMRSTYNVFKDAAGIYYEDRFVPFVESILNIVFSIIFVKIFGLVGVFLGTVISGFALWGYSYPKYVYNKIFGRSYRCYFFETIGYIMLFIALASFTYWLSMLIVIDNMLLQLIIKLVVAMVVPNLLLVVIFHKDDKFNYFKDIFFSLFRRKKM